VLDLATAVAADTSRSGVVACALYRDGQRIRDIAVEEIGALAGREAGSFGSVFTSQRRRCLAQSNRSSDSTI
jgi:hypothetical protein